MVICLCNIILKKGNMMKTKNLFILLLCSILTSQANANTLVITRGPVCSGMGNYLANAIKSLDDNYFIVSPNDTANILYHQLFNTVFPQHMAIINNAIDQENIIPAIHGYHVYFKKTAYPQQRQQAIESIKYIRQVLNDPTNENFLTALNLMKNHVEMTELAYHAACDHNVVWEKRTFTDWDYDTAHIEELFSNVLNTLTYCHPIMMIEEWQEHNNNAIAEKKASHRRLVKHVLKTFFNIFKPADEYQDAVVLLTKDEFDDIIEQAAQYITTVPLAEFGEHGVFTSSEFTLKELFDFKAQVYTEYDFENVDYALLAPILPYDILLKSQDDCLEFAQELVNG
jgi:hypothetical protein